MVGKSLDEAAIGKLVQDTIQEYDVDLDGSLSYFEFKRAMFDSDIESILQIRI